MSLRSSGLALLAVLTLSVIGCSSSSSSSGPTVPSAPASVQAAPGDGQVTVSWAAVSGATSYNLYYATTAGAGTGGTRVAGVTSPRAVTGLTNGTTYYFVVTAENSAGESAASAEASAVPAANPPPAAPTGVQATAGNASATVSWSAVSGATSYNLYYATTAGAGTGGTKVAGVTSPKAVTGLTNGTTYHFVVTAVNANGESTPSAEVSATPSANPYIAGFALTLQGGGVPPFGFLEQVRVCTDSSCNTPITDATVTVNGSALTYDATQQQYTASVAIAAGAAVTLQVTIGSTVYTAGGTQFTTAPTVSAPASGATWQAASANAISWSGGSPTGGAAYFVGVMASSGDFVYPASSGGHNGGPGEVPIATTTATVPAGTLAAGSDQVLVGIGSAGLVDQTSGGIAIANTAAGSGLWLGLMAPLVPVTVQGSNSPPAAPAGVQAVAGDGEVMVTWNASAGATSYNLYLSSTSGGGLSGTQFTGVSSGFTVTGLANGTTYYFVVTAVNGNGESSPSAEVSAAPAAGPPFIVATVLSMNAADVASVGFLEQVDVCTDSTCNTPITDATVRVNGTAIPYDAGKQQYSSSAVVVAAGGSVTVAVTVGATTYTVTGTQFTSRPTVSAPTPSAVWQASSAHTIAWTGGGPTTGASYVVGVADASGDFVFPGTLKGGPGEYPIATTSVSVPAGTLTAGGAGVLVGIGTAGIMDRTGGIAITGARSGSALWLGYVAPLVYIMVQ